MGERRIVASVVGVIAIGLLIIPNIAGAAANKQDVRVVNTEFEKVPITGSVSIAGTPEVSLSGTPAVQVANDTSNPLPVSVTSSNGSLPVEVTNLPGVRTAFQKRYFVKQLADEPSPLNGLINADRLLKMPADEILTITQVTGGGGGMHDAVNYLRLYDWCQGEQSSPVTTLPIQVSPNAEGAWPVVSQSINFEIGPNHCLHFESRRQEAVGEGITYPVTIIGYITKV